MNTRPNPWDLYDSHPKFIVATAEIEAAWEEAIRLIPEKPSVERATAAERHVYKVLEKWRHVGAIDTEPVVELRMRVKKHFGVEGKYL